MSIEGLRATSHRRFYPSSLVWGGIGALALSLILFSTPPRAVLTVVILMTGSALGVNGGFYVCAQKEYKSALGRVGGRVRTFETDLSTLAPEIQEDVAKRVESQQERELRVYEKFIESSYFGIRDEEAQRLRYACYFLTGDREALLAQWSEETGLETEVVRSLVQPRFLDGYLGHALKSISLENKHCF